MRSVGARNEFYSHWIVREFNQENYTAFCRHQGEPEAPAPPTCWRDWEVQGWWRIEPDWPIAGLYFELKEADDNMNHLLRRFRSPLIPAGRTLEYFLLQRLWRAKATTPGRIRAIGELVRVTSGVPELESLYDRALLVFRNHWRLLAMGELTARAAEAYLDLCDLERQFSTGEAGELPPLLEGLDIDHLEKNWRLGPERRALLPQDLGG